MLRPSIMDILDRVYSGPKITQKEWDLTIIPEKTAEKVKEHEIKFNPEIIVTTDKSLINDVFQAGFELALDTGVFCLDTQRIIKFSEEELKAVTKEGYQKLYYGESPNIVEVVQRQPEDKNRPVLCMGPFGQVVGEDIFIPVHESFARLKYTDVLIPGLLGKLYGREVRSRSPFEVLAGYLEATYVNEAIRRAGRHGLPKSGVVSDMSGLAQLAAYSGDYYRRYDVPECMTLASELKTTFYTLNKVVQAVYLGFERNVIPYAHPMIGGYAGGTEGNAIMAVAAVVLLGATLMGDAIEGTVTDIRTMGNTTKEALTANSIAIQAINQNTKIKYVCDNTGSLDVYTEPLFYEVANCQMILTVSGVAYTNGPRPGGGKIPEHATPVEAYFMGEVSENSAGMKREHANELALELLPKYEKLLKYPPQGKSFREIMDLKTLKPKQEWVQMYQKAKKDLVEIGLLRG